MAKKKQISLGSVLEWDKQGGTTYVVIGVIPSIDPPDEEDEEIEAVCLEDVKNVPLSGIDAQGEATFEVFLDPTDAGDTTDADLYAARLNRTVVAFRILMPHKGFAAGTTGVPTVEFKGRVRAYARQELTPSDSIRYIITVRLTEPSVNGTYDVPGP